MARADYFAVERAIAERLANDEALVEEAVPVLIEVEVSALPGRQIVVYLDSRAAPAGVQSLSAGSRTRMHVRYAIVCYGHDLQIARAMELRDDLMGRVEVALMRDPRDFGREEVVTSWLDGGAFANAKGQGAPGFMAMGEVGLVVDMVAVR